MLLWVVVLAIVVPNFNYESNVNIKNIKKQSDLYLACSPYFKLLIMQNKSELFSFNFFNVLKSHISKYLLFFFFRKDTYIVAILCFFLFSNENNSFLCYKEYRSNYFLDFFFLINLKIRTTSLTSFKVLIFNYDEPWSK